MNHLVAGVVGSSTRVVKLGAGAACRRYGGGEAEKMNEVVKTLYYDLWQKPGLIPR